MPIRIVHGADLAEILGMVKLGMNIITRNDLGIGVSSGKLFIPNADGYAIADFVEIPRITFDVMVRDGTTIVPGSNSCPVGMYDNGAVATVPGNDAVMHFLFRHPTEGGFVWLLGQKKYSSISVLLRAGFSFLSNIEVPQVLDDYVFVAAFAAAANANKTKGTYRFHVYNGPKFTDSSLFTFY